MRLTVSRSSKPERETSYPDDKSSPAVMRAFPRKELTMSAIITDNFGGFCSVESLAQPAAIDDLAKVFRLRLQPNERMTLARAAMMSLDPDSRDKVLRAAERGVKADAVFRGAWRHG